MWYCCKFVLILQESGEIEEEYGIEKFLHGPCTISRGPYNLDSTADTTADSTTEETQAHGPCSISHGPCQVIPKTNPEFGNKANGRKVGQKDI